MSILTYQDICGLIDAGVIENTSREFVNATSLDITLGETILVESIPRVTVDTGWPRVVSLRQREPLTTQKVTLTEEKGFILRPGQFILAQSAEIFHLPNTLSAKYILNSSMARIGLEHLNAGWCDAGWNNSVLTLELRNLTTYHEIELRLGDRVGQLVFYPHKAVADEGNYANKGSYNSDREVSGAKFKPTRCKNCEE